MSGKPPHVFRSLKVHEASRPGAVRDGPRSDALRPRFADLVKRRHAALSPIPVVAPQGTDERVETRDPDPLAAKSADPEGSMRGRLSEPPLEPGGEPEDESDEAACADRLPPHTSIEAGTLTSESPDGIGADGTDADAARPIALGTDARGRRMVEHIAATVTRFCNDPAVRGGDGWQVRVWLREDVLASTQLHLGLSAHWLQLRFETADDASHRLISQHRGSLEALLSEALVPRREISITFD